MEIAWHLIVLIVTGFAMIRGWRLGFIGQMGGVLGVAFGVVTAHLFMDPAAHFFMQLHLWPIDNVAAHFASQLLGCSAIYAITYFALWCFGRLLAEAMSIIPTGILNALFGSAICIAKYLIALSIFFNIAVASNPQSLLMKYACDDDGNIVQGVMNIAHPALGCQSYWDLAHIIQLREAKKISLNFTLPQDVILLDNDYSTLSS